VINSDYIRYPLFASLFPLYSKLKPEHLLSNRLRKRIYVYVQNNPGEHFRSILVNLNLTNGTLAHHLHTLEKEDLIRSQRDGLYRRFYPAGYHIEEDKVSLSPIQKRIVGLIQNEPGLSQKEISHKLELSNSTVNYNIKALKDKGMIDMTKEGKSTHVFLRPDENS
jgi:predicted transcriptional regulator